MALRHTGPQAGVESGGCGTGPAQVEHGQGLGSSGGAGHPSTISAIVPDGVAAITLYFCARGADRHGSPGRQAITTTTRPVGNVMVARGPLGASDPNPREIVWRSAGGSILETIREP